MEVLDTASKFLEATVGDPTSVGFTLILSVAIILVTVILAVYVRYASIRVVLISLFAIGAFVLSKQLAGQGQAFLFNLSTEFVGATIGIIIFADLLMDVISSTTAGRWLTLGMAALIVLVVPFLFQIAGAHNRLSDDFILNLRTDMLGAYIVFVLTTNRFIDFDLKVDKEHADELNNIDKTLSQYRTMLKGRYLELRKQQAELKQDEIAISIREQHLAREQLTLENQRSKLEARLAAVKKERATLFAFERNIEKLEAEVQKTRKPQDLIISLEARCNQMRLEANFDYDTALEGRYAIAQGYEQAIEDCRQFFAKQS